MSPGTDRPEDDRQSGRRFGLTKRGRVEVGYFADLVVFDPDRVIEQRDLRRPYPAARGHPPCSGERSGGGGQRAMHRRDGRPGGTLVPSPLAEKVRMRG